MSASHFWRYPQWPHLELRRVEDGREVHYAPHSHKQWSLGAITHGISTFQYRDDHYDISEGDLVLMNPEWVHSCNPVDNQPWAYWMLYVDSDWLTQLRIELGLQTDAQWRDIHTAVVTESASKASPYHWYQLYCDMAAALTDPQAETLEKQSLFVDFMALLMEYLDQQQGATKQPSNSSDSSALDDVAGYLDRALTDAPTLEDLIELANCSEGHLIRSFRRRYGLTPHAYLLNRRIQKSQELLRNGCDITEVAQQLAFADQAHFQRTFKKLTATTPGQYQLNARVAAKGQ